MARPKKEIDAESFEKLCAMQLSKREICKFFEVTNNTLDRWTRETYKDSFSNIFAQKKLLGKIRLREWQFRLAETSPQMAIFLGKNYLGQKEGSGTDGDGQRIAADIENVPGTDLREFWRS